MWRRFLKRPAPAPVILTIEEHTLMGGLGSAVAEIIAEAGFNPANASNASASPMSFRINTAPKPG